MYDVGEAALQIVASFTGIQRAIETEARKWNGTIQAAVIGALPDALRAGARNMAATGGRAGADYGGAFADTVKSRVTAALASLPKAKPGVDATELDAELEEIRRRLAELGDVRVGVDLSADEALAEIDALRSRLDELGARSPDINVRVDAARAETELAAVQGQVDRLDGRVANVTVRQRTESVGDFGGPSGLLGLGGVGLGALAVPIGAAGIGGIAGVGAAAAAGATGLAATVLGLQGVTAAVQAVDKANKSTATSATRSGAAQTSAANQVRSAEEALANTRAQADSAAVRAAEQVKNARQSLADTERSVAQAQAQAARQVQQAEQNLTSANQAAASAQQALNTAREQAVRDLQSYANQAVDAQIAEQQATLNLAAAQQNLVTVNASATSTDLQRQQAALDVAAAQQAVYESQERAAQATSDNAAAQAAGVNGAPGVVSASQAVAAAHSRQANAHQQVTDAQQAQTAAAVAGAEQIAKAQQAVTDAIRAQADQQRQSAYSVRQAEQAVTTAIQAQGRAAATSSTATRAAAVALAGLSPAGREFASFVVGTLEPAFNRIKAVAQANLLPGLEEGIKAALPLLPGFIGFVGGISKVMGDLARDAGKALTAPFWTGFFRFVAATAAPTLSTLGHVLGNVITGFAGLAEGFGPVVKQVGDGVLQLSGGFARFGTHVGTSSAFHQFIGYIQTEGPVVARVFGNLFTIVGKLFEALAPFATVLLGVVDALTSFLAPLSPGALLAIAEAVVALFIAFKVGMVAMKIMALEDAGAWAVLNAVMDANPLGIVILAIAALAAGLIYAYEHSKTFRDIVRSTWAVIGTVITGTWRDVIKPVVDAFSAFFGRILPDAIGTAISWVKDHWPLLLGILAGPIGLAAGEIIQHWGAIEGGFKSAFGAVSSSAKSIWSDIAGFFRSGINDVIGMLDWFIDKVDDVLGFFHLPKIPKIPAISSGAKSSASPGRGRAQKPIAAATGGIIPGYAPGIDSVLAMLSPGEAVLRPEVARWLGADVIDSLNRAGILGRLPRFKGGGILGKITSTVGGALGDAAGIGRSLLGKGVAATLDALEAPARRLINLIPSGMFQGIANGLFDRVNSGVRQLVGGHTGAGKNKPVSGAVSAVQKTAQGLLPQFGWDGSQMPSLIALWNRESGWNYRATNPSSGAYGIPQSLPASKMASAGADWRTNPLTQILWGLTYIKGRYGSPSSAWGHETAFGWYDQGGYLPPGVSIAVNGTGRPEPVGHHLVDPSQLVAGGAGGVEARLDRVSQQLAALTAVTGQQGQQFGAALNGAAAGQSRRSEAKVGR